LGILVLHNEGKARVVDGPVFNTATCCCLSALVGSFVLLSTRSRLTCVLAKPGARCVTELRINEIRLGRISFAAPALIPAHRATDGIPSRCAGLVGTLADTVELVSGVQFEIAGRLEAALDRGCANCWCCRRLLDGLIRTGSDDLCWRLGPSPHALGGGVDSGDQGRSENQDRPHCDGFCGWLMRKPGLFLSSSRFSGSSDGCDLSLPDCSGTSRRSCGVVGCKVLSSTSGQQNLFFRGMNLCCQRYRREQQRARGPLRSESKR
jgi:hypothetical protein